MKIRISVIIAILATIVAFSFGKNQKITDNMYGNACTIPKDSMHNHHTEYKQEINTIWESDATNVRELSWRQLMDRILPQVIRYSQDESASSVFFNNAMALYFPENEISYTLDRDSVELIPHIFSYSDDPDMLLITKAIYKKYTFAIMYTGNDNSLHFFRLNENQWKPIGIGKVSYDITMGKIYLEELNGEPGFEIVVSSYPPNMNGNTWKELFIYKEKEDKVKFAGTFSTNYSVDLKSKTVKEEYAGSLYMNPHKTLYIWHNDMLVPKKKVVIDVPGDWDTNDKRTLKYYENPSLEYTPDIERMKLVYKKDFDLSQYDGYPKVWDNFFEKPDNK